MVTGGDLGGTVYMTNMTTGQILAEIPTSGMQTDLSDFGIFLHPHVQPVKSKKHQKWVLTPFQNVLIPIMFRSILDKM